MNFDVSHVFAKTYETFLNSKAEFKKDAKLIIHEGSARSGKTWSILQFLFLLSFKHTGLEIVLARDTLKNCKDTILKDFLKILQLSEVNFKYNKSENTININSNEYKFIGLDDPHKGHGAGQDILYVNEIMKVKEESFNQRMIRTSLFTIVDYNPSEDRHYIYNYKKRERAVYYKSALFKEVEGKHKTYDKHKVVDYDKETNTSISLLNPFAPDEQVDEILSFRPCLKNDQQGTTKPWHWQVYGLGNKAAKEGLIFNNWSIIDNYDSIKGEEVYYGIDFGVVHPTAMVEVKRIGKSLYVKQVIYQSNIRIKDIISTIKKEIPSHAPVIADCAGLVQIEEMYTQGINVHSCKKTKDFKNNKIEQIQGFKIYIDSKSEDFINEISSWMWRQDRFGNILPEPVKIEDDAMDAFIYALENMKEEKFNPTFKIYNT